METQRPRTDLLMSKSLYRALLIGVSVLGATIAPTQDAIAKLVCEKGNCENGYGKGHGTNSGTRFDGEWRDGKPWTGWKTLSTGYTYYIKDGQKYYGEVERPRSDNQGSSTTCEPDFRYKDGGADVGYCGNNGARLQCGYGDTAFPTDYWCYSGGTSYGATLQSAVNKACGCD